MASELQREQDSIPSTSFVSINQPGDFNTAPPPGNNYPSNQHHTVDIQVASVFEGNNIVGIDDPLQILNRKLRLRNCLVTFVIFFALDFICFLRFFFLPRTLVALFGGPLYYFYSPWYLWLILVAGFQFFFISQLFGGIRYIKYIKWIGKTFFPQQQRSMSEIDGGGDRIQDAHRLDQPLHVYLQGDEHIQHSDKFESPMTANEDDPPPPVAKQVILPGDISIRSLAIPADVEGEDMDERRGGVHHIEGYSNNHNHNPHHNSSFTSGNAISSTRTAATTTMTPTIVNNARVAVETKSLMWVSRSVSVMLGFVYAVDILLTVVSGAIDFIIIYFIFTEPDKRISPGWMTNYSYIAADASFAIISLVMKVCLLICAIIMSHCTQPWESISRVQVLRLEDEVISKKHQNRLENILCCISIAQAAFVVISFAFLCTALNDYVIATRPIPSNAYADCDPMITKACALPFPSNYWLIQDSSTVTGYRVNLGPNTLPYTRRQVHMDRSHLNSHDGFSVSGSIIWHLAGGVDDTKLVSYQDIVRSVKFNSTTLLLDFDRKTLAPHFTEADYLDDSDDRVMYMQPSTSLSYNTNYIAIVKGVTNKNGDILSASPLTQSYIDAFESKSSDVIDPRYQRLVPVFTYLQSQFNQSVSKLNIQLIWDFHTASQQSTLGPLLSVQAAATARTVLAINTADASIKASGNTTRSPLYENTLGTFSICTSGSGDGVVGGGFGSKMASTQYYTIKVPWFLENTGREANAIRPDLQNLDVSNVDNVNRVPLVGEIGIIVLIPCSVSTGVMLPRMLIEFGHGLFSDRQDALSPWLREEANKMGYILWAMDWRGFSRYDIPLVARMLMHDSKLIASVEAAVIQGYVSKLAGKLIVRHILQYEGIALGVPDTSLTALSRIPNYYYGDSMGSILGAGYICFVNYQRAALMVGGSPFTFLLGRSDLFSLYLQLLKILYYNAVDIRIAMTSWQLPLDAAESSGWKNTGEYNKKNILLQVGLGDSTVTPIAGRILGANVNASLLDPSFFQVAFMRTIQQPSPNIGIPLTPGLNVLFQGMYTSDFASIHKNAVIQTGTNVHGCFPSNPRVMQQNSYFVGSGSVINPCGNSACTLGDTAPDSCGSG